MERATEDIQSTSSRRRRVGEEAQAGVIEAVEKREPENDSRGKEEKREGKGAMGRRPRGIGEKGLV